MFARLGSLLFKDHIPAQVRSSNRLFSTSSTTKTISNFFTELKVKAVQRDIFDNKSYAPSIDVTLSKNIDPKSLPYADVYTKEKLAEEQLQRIDSCMVVARGDSRSPQQLLMLGGFHPQATNPYSSQKFGEEILDVISHRDLAWGSGLVSFTSSLSVAMNIPGAHYVYFAKVIGAIGPHPTYRITEKEYSLPGGLDFEEIISFRELSKSSFNHSSIFISNAFKTNYPDKIQPIAAAYLRSDECCFMDGEVIQPIHRKEFLSKHSQLASVDHVAFFTKVLTTKNSNLSEKMIIPQLETNFSRNNNF